LIFPDIYRTAAKRPNYESLATVEARVKIRNPNALTLLEIPSLRGGISLEVTASPSASQLYSHYTSLRGNLLNTRTLENL
jgi:hypothetical protein